MLPCPLPAPIQPDQHVRIRCDVAIAHVQQRAPSASYVIAHSPTTSPQTTKQPYTPRAQRLEPQRCTDGSTNTSGTAATQAPALARALAMASAGRRRSITSSLGRSSRDQSLAAPADRPLTKSASASALSVGSDGPGDTHDGALDRLKSRNSDDGRSDSSSTRPRRLSGLFKRKKRTAHGSRDDLAQVQVPDHVPADIRRPSAEPRNHSDDSLGLHKSVASSLLTEDSDSDT